MPRTYIKTGKKQGQPTKFNPDRCQVIIEALQKHNYLSTACELANIDETTFYNWLDKAEAYKTRLLDKEYIIDAEGEAYISFFNAVSQARAGSERELLGRIDKAGSEAQLIEQRTITHTLKDGTTKSETIERWKPADWQANGWILERTKWAKYGQHSSLDIQQAGVVFIEKIQRARSAKIVDGEFREVLDQIAKEPVPEEIPGERPLAIPQKAVSPATETKQATTRRRPIFELIAKRKGIASENGRCTTPSPPASEETSGEPAAARNKADKCEGG